MLNSLPFPASDDSRLPIPDSRFPTPDSRLPVYRYSSLVIIFDLFT
ncbi:hypothetical protein [Moorena producens]